MPDLDLDLADLAEQVGRTARLEPAETVRARADRRRRRRYTTATALGVVAAIALGAGVALAGPDAAPPSPPVPVASPTPAPSAGGRQPIDFDRRRANRIVPSLETGTVGLANGPSGIVRLADPGWPFTLQRIAPGSTEWLIRLDEKDGGRCLMALRDRRISFGPCSAADANVRFDLSPATADRPGQVTYLIRNRAGDGGDSLLCRDRADGRVYLKPVPAKGDRAEVTTWQIVDIGPSTLAG